MKCFVSKKFDLMFKSKSGNVLYKNGGQNSQLT